MNNPNTLNQAFNAPAVQGQHDLAVISAAAEEKALVESRYVMAMHNPRNMDQFRQSLLKECHRPSFAANKSALYKKPIGQGIEGLGIRFVEVAFRCMKNILIQSKTVHDSPEKQVVKVVVTDLESNISYDADLNITKTVERSKPSSDGTYLSVRENTNGYAVYTVYATDDDLLNKVNALKSKAIRTLGLRIIPGDLQDEAEAVIRQVRLDKAAADPDAERKSVVDAFSRINVKASQLVAYLGHEIDECSPAELIDLRGFYGAIRDGETTWAAIIENKQNNDDTNKESESGSGATDLNEKLKKTTPVKKRATAKKKVAQKPKEEKQTSNDPAVDGPENVEPKKQTKQRSASYADIMTLINAAQSDDDVCIAVDLANGLPADQKAEIQAAAAEAARKIEDIEND